MKKRDKYRLAQFLSRNRFDRMCDRLRGTVTILGDIISPEEPDGTWFDEDEWDELYGPLITAQTSKDK